MTDNILANPGAGPNAVPLATDNVGGTHFARCKLTLGGDGVDAGDVAAGNPLPITGVVAIGGSPVAVTGTFYQATQPVSVSALPLPSGAATETTLAAVSAKLAASIAVTGTFWQSTQPVSIASTVTVTGAGGTFPVTGTFWQATQPVSIASAVAVTGTFWQATQPVSGPLTDTQLRASAVPVSAASLPLPSGAATETTLAAVNTKLGGTLAVSNTSLPLPTGASTETTLAALSTKVPAQGAALTASSLPVNVASDQVLNVSQQVTTASGSITTQNLAAGGTATAGSAVEITLSGNTSLAIQTTGTYTGALSLQVTADGTNWITLGGTPLINLNTGGYLAAVTSALASVFQADVGGFLKARVTGLAAMTGTAVVTLRASSNPSMVALDAPLPTGANTIGAVTTSGTVTNVLNTAQGAAVFLHAISAATTNATSVKASAGTINAIVLTNASAAIKFFKLYNKASAPTVGTDTPVATIGIPAGQTVVFPCGAFGMRFNTGIAYALTGLITVADTTAVALSDVAVHIQYL